MKVLVTGGAGFIGSHIVDRLLDLAYEVVVIDNLATGSYVHRSDVSFYPMDIRSPELDHVFQLEKPDVVIHQAAQVSVQESIRAPLRDCHLNVMGTVNVLDCCVKHNVGKVIYASSAAVYGPPEQLPVREDDSVSPMSFYGLSKWTAEQYIRLYSLLYHLKFTILRYANIYGPRQNTKGEAGVIALFTDRLLNEEQIIIYGDGKQTRDFIYVRDVVNANIASIHAGDNGIYNISTDKEVSINQVFDTIRKYAKKQSDCIYRQEQSGDIRRSRLQNAKARKELKWKPVISLEAGIKEVIEDFSKRK
ncbi:NAD-dependent epimerase/dehydratase family protein [Salimicrobium halophilum]|uniref:UDP-glucose 4-epimerase n=1 Tax=Salimicrobium halophilum TaxID=86666 RepID=A0A1G8UHF6_9BACI|nr:NAD-dependent epimerase/dehydratase family protein [Salimicrobium halophilum]SDJ53222.1 UDP-glucose 4-epimerase [Salimicrobium halophilum]